MHLFKSVFATVTSVLGYTLITSIPALAANQQILLSQTGGIAGECRQTNQSISVYENRSSESKELVNLRQHEQVFLGEDSTIGGWIAVDWPAEGYVNAQYLTECETFDPTIATPFCFHDRYEQGDTLVLYDPDNKSTPYERLFYGDQIQVLSQPEDADSNGVEWLETVLPFEGWVIYNSPTLEDVNFVACNVPED